MQPKTYFKKFVVKTNLSVNVARIDITAVGATGNVVLFGLYCVTQCYVLIYAREPTKNPVKYLAYFVVFHEKIVRI